MANPFRVTGPATSGIDAGKLPGTRDTAKTADALLRQARDQGKLVSDVVRENPVPDGETAISWPAAGPTNDAGRPPMKLGG
jgi:hypothetical protein